MPEADDDKPDALDRVRVGAAIVCVGLFALVVLASIFGRQVDPIVFGGVMGTLLALLGIDTLVRRGPALMELWVDFALSLAAAVAWTVTAATSLRSIRFKRPTTREAQLAGLVALLGLTWLLTVSSLAKPGVIPPEWPKVLTLAARWLLVVTGLWALIAQRYRRHE